MPENTQITLMIGGLNEVRFNLFRKTKGKRSTALAEEVPHLNSHGR